MQQRDLFENPMGLDGFEFVEYATLDVNKLISQFEQMGFSKIARHRTRDNVFLMRQGDINFIVNGEPNSVAQQFAKDHGPSAFSMGFRVKDANAVVERAVKLDAIAYEYEAKPGECKLPAIQGIGGSVIYFIEAPYSAFYDVNFELLPGVNPHPKGAGLTYIDHLTHNVFRGRMDYWAEFYSRLFNFREIRYFDIKGQKTGLVSRALSSPCNKIRIPLNESTDDLSQIEEFIKDFNGEGIQHIALGTDDIYHTVETLRAQGQSFMDVPDTYYEMMDDRLPGHGEDLPRLHKNYIIVDGDTRSGEKKLLLQIFTNTMLGPVFFEIIQRKGDEGFGEGNFKALFESIERDQIRRGVVPGKL